MGECFLYGNGGGGGSSELNYRVYASASTPSSPEANDIWIKSSTAVSAYRFCSNTPTGSSTSGGNVYIVAATSSDKTNDNTVPVLNILKKKMNGNLIRCLLNLTGCRQVIGGVWENVDAYLYKGGSWLQFSYAFSATINVSYPPGSTCTATDGVTTLNAPDTSGTWECIVPNAGTWTISSTASSFQAEVTITTSGQVAEADVSKLYLQKGSSINYPTSFTNVKTSILDNGVKYMQNGSSSRATAHFGPLSLTGATKLYVKLTAGYAHASPVPCICVSTSLLKNHPSADLTRFTVGSGDSNSGVGVTSGTYVMDISGYSGEYYVALDWEGKSGNNTYLTTEAIWLEV